MDFKPIGLCSRWGHRPRIRAGVLGSLVLLGANPFTAAGQALIPLEGVPGLGGGSLAESISGDGSTVVGFGPRVIIDETTALRWVHGGAPELLAPDLWSYSFAYAASHDGWTVVGHAAVPGGAFRWTPQSGMQPLGESPAAAYGVSADGSVVVGELFFSNPQAQHAFRWTESGGYEDLGTFPGGQFARAEDVSADGRVVVGWGHAPDEPVAFRWTSETGMQSLGTLPTGDLSVARAISADGTTAVGWAHTGAASTHIVRWTVPGGLEDLGTLPGWPYAIANDVSADGSVIVGYAYMSGGSARRGVVWRRDLGVVDITDYLVSRGVDVEGWNIFDVAAVSDDGHTLAGTGFYNGRTTAWVVDLPACPADFNADARVNSQDFFDFIVAFFASDPRCDFNLDGTVTSEDFFAFVTEFLAGCI